MNPQPLIHHSPRSPPQAANADRGIDRLSPPTCENEPLVPFLNLRTRDHFNIPVLVHRGLLDDPSCYPHALNQAILIFARCQEVWADGRRLERIGGLKMNCSDRLRPKLGNPNSHARHTIEYT